LVSELEIHLALLLLASDHFAGNPIQRFIESFLGAINPIEAARPGELASMEGSSRDG